MSHEKLKRGTLVELIPHGDHFSWTAWTGMLCRVVGRGFFPTDAILEPLTRRPDGRSVQTFAWPTSQLRRVLR